MKKFPCGICKKTVAANHSAVCCDICNKWVHISSNNITRYCYRKLQKDETPWYRKICLGQAMPFSNLTGHQLEAFMLGKLKTSPKLIYNQITSYSSQMRIQKIYQKISTWHLTTSLKFKIQQKVNNSIYI